jgi:hypothetical protein
VTNRHIIQLTRHELNAVADAVEMRIKALEEAVLEGTASEDDKTELGRLNDATLQF